MKRDTDKWDERYGSEDYAYGTTPNTFLEEHFKAIPRGKVLSLAEGEGRNAVFLAKQGYSVTAVDGSSVGLQKARKLAEANGVNVELIHADLSEFDIGENQWDGVVSIFCPVPSVLRIKLHKRVVAGLRNGGVLVLEAYTPKQMSFGTGGGNSLDVLMTKETILAELGCLQFDHLVELEREVIEGQYHTGLAAVVQAIATKRA